MTATPRQLGVVLILSVGVITLVSAMLLNPMVAAWIQGPRYVDSADVLGNYFGWSLGLGIGYIALAYRVSKGPGWADNAALIALVLGGIVLVDRFLLTRLGLTMWTHDSEIHYKHRPNTVRSLAQFGRPEDYIQINKWGFHGPDFPLEKPDGEFRVLAIGDSVTMGYGLTYSETFSAHLENHLNDMSGQHHTYRVINAGVHGYSTYHEKVVLQRSLKFAPDLILIGFCMNDVTEPFVVDRDLGGIGLDYHGVWQASSAVVGWLANETGFGRLTQTFAKRGRTLESERLLETYDVSRMAAAPRDDELFGSAWDLILEQLEEIYGIARTGNTPVLLVIFPYTIQLIDQSLHNPQRILAEHAHDHNVPVLDLTSSLRSAVFDHEELVDSDGLSPASMAHNLDLRSARIEQFFFDDSHLTERGHVLAAQEIIDHLREIGVTGEL